MCDHETIFSELAKSPGYPSNSNMSQFGEWGTEIEVYAFASMMGTPITIYGPCGNQTGSLFYKWLTYGPLEGIPRMTEFPQTTERMYISNTDSHFEPVLMV